MSQSAGNCSSTEDGIQHYRETRALLIIPHVCGYKLALNACLLTWRRIVQSVEGCSIQRLSCAHPLSLRFRVTLPNICMSLPTVDVARLFKCTTHLPLPTEGNVLLRLYLYVRILRYWKLKMLYP